MRIVTAIFGRRWRTARILAVAGVVGLASALVFTAPAPRAAPGDQATELTTTVTGGAVQGMRSAGIIQYLGVPFAASTAGPHRFAPPQPAPPWAGIRPATAHGPQCPQSSPLPHVPALQPSSEDCLTIDVYVPEHASGTALPVMVWLYGGGFVLGSNAQYDSPARLVRDGQVIVAIPNYRVGPFGFLALPELAADDSGITGTYGTLDQQAALRWIQDNAAAFGGDPGNVTLFGESAGGMSVCTQLASPTARGLFTKAIIQSGACARSPLVPPTVDRAYQRSADYASSLGCGDSATRLRCLREMPVDRLLSSPTTMLNTMDATWTPVRDGVVVTSTPEDALATGVAREIPLIVGSNADEGATFLALLDYARGAVPTAAEYVDWVRNSFGDHSDRVLARYPMADFDTPAAAKQQVITDGFFACPALFTTEAARRGGGQVWQYRFNDAPLGQNPLLPGAFHAAEIPYVFSALMGVPIPLPPDADRLSQHIQQSWAHFAHTGSPETPALAPWPTTTPTTLELSRDRIALSESFSPAHRCDLWSTISQIGQ
ncbi:carboxylesterase/lipase family protein [Nocardia mangyaensis]|uniref:carboxylesterase/lipase family protein n=1 Tax=Nocardia mangyaensis TaxID=2213200 RepID=UPI0026752E48|nr:carboxylesterase family protein [Nocardia mangyaensis]MDO3650434.1 carboxylesterase family protein [Nocardia mangyaensis]